MTRRLAAVGLFCLLTVTGTALAASPVQESGSAAPPGSAQALQQSGRWRAQNSGVGRTLRDVVFVDRETGWAVGGERDDDCLIIHTRDGGATWTPQRCPVRIRLEAVDFVDQANGWAVGLAGLVLRTYDAGETWHYQRSDTSSTLTAIDAWDVNTARAAMRTGEILRTTDGGARWRVTRTDNGQGLFDISFPDADNGWAVGSAGTVLRTSDGGRNWQLQGTGIDDRFLAVDFVDASRGWAVGNGIRHTADGGSSWHSQARKSIPKTLEDVDMVDAEYGWAVGDEGTVVRTTDGGRTWSFDAEGMTNRGMRGVFFLDRYFGWTVGTGGTIFHYVGVLPTDTPTATPTPTATSTPTPTATFTPTATPTPRGAWMDTGYPLQLLMVPERGTIPLRVEYGNLPADSVLQADLKGSAEFGNYGAEGQSYSTPLGASNGETTLLLRAVEAARPGQSFTLDIQAGGARALRLGIVSYRALLPALAR